VDWAGEEYGADWLVITAGNIISMLILFITFMQFNVVRVIRVVSPNITTQAKRNG
jgi:hypothetical protein